MLKTKYTSFNTKKKKKNTYFNVWITLKALYCYQKSNCLTRIFKKINRTIRVTDGIRVIPSVLLYPEVTVEEVPFHLLLYCQEQHLLRSV